MKKKLPAFLILAIISLVAALALALTNSLTEGPIQERAQAALRAARQVVLPADTFEEVESSDEAVAVHVGKANGEAIGYTGVVTVTGYAGPVEVILGTDNNGVITGISVGGANFAETAGLGSKAKEPGFTDQFKDKTLPVGLGANIDAIGGATITSRAVVNGVNQAGTAIAAAAGFELGEAPAAPVEEEVEIGAVAAGTMTGESQGFQSTVKATVTVGADGLISEVVIASAEETQGFGTKLDGNAEFAAQFVGKMGPFAIGEGIDAVAGATVTSEAAVKAVNQALVNGPEAPKPAAGTADGEAQGFQSTVKATVTVGDDGLVSEVVIASAEETQGFGTKLDGNAEFAAQFVGKAAPFKAGEGIDVLAGATVTSKAAIEAVNNAVSALAAPAGQTADGEAQGFQSTVKATITVGEDGLISNVVISSAEETQGFGTRLDGDAAFAAQFVGKAAPFTLGNGIEAVSGATVTSEAAVKAVNDAASKVPAAGETLTVISETEAGTVAVNSKGQLVISFPEGFAGDVNAAFTLDDKGNVTEAVLTPVVTSNATVEGNTATSEAQGFESKVKATVTVDGNGVITEVKLNTQNETEYFGMGVGDSTWPQKFVGKTGPFEIGKDGIDAYSGATFTSKAAVEAINDCLLGLEQNKGAVAVSAPAEETAAPAEETAAPSNTAEGTAQGFESQVKATVTVDETGAISEIKLFTQNETEYFGMGVGDSDWAKKFVGKVGPFEIGKDEIDAYSGATFTSKACVEAINAALAQIAPAAPAEEAAPVEETAAPSNTAEGTAQGFESQVKATVTVDETGAISEIKLFTQNETEYFGMGVGDSDWAKKFEGKVGPFEIGKDGIDAYSGATFTSKACVEAINAALAQIAPAAPAEEAAAPAGTVYEGTAKGFQSDVKVTVTVGEDGNVANVVIESAGETEGFGTKLNGNADFAAQFVGKPGPFAIGEGIDAVAMATVTSKAVVEAVNAALPAPAAEGKTVEGEGKGFQSTVKVTVTVGADGLVSDVQIASADETEGFGTKLNGNADFAAQFVGKAGPFAIGEGIDAVAMATVTSKAVVEAVNAALAK